MQQGAPWYKRYPRAYIDGVQGLKPHLTGAYSVLLDLIYMRGGTSKRDDIHLAGFLRVSPQIATTMTDALIAAGKIEDAGGRLTNPLATRIVRMVDDTDAPREKRGQRFYRHDPQSYLDAAQGLGPVTIGVYSVLLDMIHLRQGATVRDDRHMAGLMHSHVNCIRPAVDRVLAQGRLVTDGTILREASGWPISHGATVSDIRAEAGRRGGIASGKSRRGVSDEVRSKLKMGA